MLENKSQESDLSKQRGWKRPHDPCLPLPLKPGSTHCGNLLLQQIRVYEATNWAGENLAPVLPGVPWDKSYSPDTAARAAYREEGKKWGPSICWRQMCLHPLLEHVEAGQTDRWIWLCMEQTPLPLPFFELLVTVLTAETPAFPGSIRHMSPATGITVAHAFCCW